MTGHLNVGGFYKVTAGQSAPVVTDYRKVEAVVHHIEQGMSPKDASLKAMEEVSGPVVAMTLVLTGVFVPVAPPLRTSSTEAPSTPFQ